MKIFYNIGSIFTLLSSILLISLVSCTNKEVHEEGDKEENHIFHWSYEADDGPDKWGAMVGTGEYCRTMKKKVLITLAIR